MASRPISRSCLQLASSHSRAFVQLLPKRHLHSAPLFDFLVPSIPATEVVRHGLQRNQVSSAKSSQLIKRAFNTSAARRTTTAIVNPKKDDDGADMSVEITPRASNRLKEIMAKDANPDLALRITVESGGCHGFQYLMSLTTLPPLHQHVDGTSPENGIAALDEEDTVFAADDGSGAKVVMDTPSLELLKGSKIDFTMELIGSQFKIVDNPLATSSCGCGTSFDIKG